MFINNFDPVAFQIMSLEIRWYSLAYIFGILIGWLLCKKIFISNTLGYIVFYNLNYYLNNFFDVFKIWQGGMSFHGGLLGIIIASIIFAKKNNQDPFIYMDQVSLVAPIGIFFGRLANFINSELYGTFSNVPWSVIFVKVDSLTRHPSQLYEAVLEGLILFLILMYFRKKKFLSKPGTISGLFLIFYSVFRFFVEFYRAPDDQIGYLAFNLTTGQIISLVFLIIGTTIFYIKNENK